MTAIFKLVMNQPKILMSMKKHRKIPNFLSNPKIPLPLMILARKSRNLQILLTQFKANLRRISKILSKKYKSSE
jgi:hypothetical protein